MSVHGFGGPTTVVHVPKEIETCAENEAVVVFGEPPSYEQALADGVHATRAAHRSRFFRNSDLSGLSGSDDISIVGAGNSSTTGSHARSEPTMF